MRNKGCTVPGCTNTHHIGGLCRPHWLQTPFIKSKYAGYVRDFVSKKLNYKKQYSGLLREKYT